MFDVCLGHRQALGAGDALGRGGEVVRCREILIQSRTGPETVWLCGTLVPNPRDMADERARTAAKGWLTRAASKLEALLARTDVDSDQWRIEGAIAQSEFLKRLDAFDAAQCAVEASIDEDNLLEDIEKACLFRDSFLPLRARFSKALDSGAGDAPGSHASHVKVKLPTLHLPTFDGEVEKWPLFWESFETSVAGTDLPAVSKLTYLRSLLRGDAAACIAGLALTGANYETACDLLTKRFGRPERLVFIHIQALLNLSVSQDLKKLQNVLLVHIRSLQVLKKEGENYGMFLTPLVLSKLPEDIRLEWARGSEGKESDLDHLLQFISSEIERRERSGSYCQLDRPAATGKGGQSSVAGRRLPGGPPSGHSAGAAGRFRPGRRPAAAALQTSTEAASACGFCNAHHHTAKCPEWLKLSRSDRFEKIRAARLCFCCLSADHIARLCSVRCKQCSGRHHSLCCLRREGYPAADRGQAGAQAPAVEQLSSHGVGGHNGVSLSSHSGGGGSGVVAYGACGGIGA